MIAVIAGGIFLHLFIHGGLAVFFLDDHVGHGGVQRAQRAQIGLHKIVAQRQIIKFYGAGSGTHLTVMGNTFIRSILDRRSREIRRGCAGLPDNIAVGLVDINVSAARRAFRKERRPFFTDRIVDRAIVGIVTV